MDLTLLALDTSTSRAALALIVGAADGTSRVFTARPDPSMRHGRMLLPAVRDLLRSVGVSVTDLDGIAVGLGPGSYTGLRIGLTAAKALAYAARKPLVGLDSLEIVARNAPAAARSVAAIGDAQRGDVYCAEFTRRVPQGALERVGETRVVSLGPWAEGVPAGAFVLGPALEVPRLAAGVPGHAVHADDPAANWPNPSGLADLAVETWRSGRRDDVFALEPVYLRRSAAEDLWDRKKEPPPP